MQAANVAAVMPWNYDVPSMEELGCAGAWSMRCADMAKDPAFVARTAKALREFMAKELAKRAAGKGVRGALLAFFQRDDWA